MSTNGQLVFTDVDKITFKGVGNASNAVIDTLTGKIGVGVDSPEANLHVLGNSYVSTNLELGGTLIMGTVNVEAQHSLEAVTATGNTTPLTVEFTNPTTSLVASGNVVVTGNVTADHFVGDGSNITGISSTLQAITDSGNVTSNTVQFSNATTGFVTTANVEVGGELTVSNILAKTTLLAHSQQKVVSSDRGSQDNFGKSVSISGDGNFAVVGAHQEDEDVSGSSTLSNAGAAYIYKYNGSTWSQVQKIVASDRAVNTQFGWSVSISNDGNSIVIGAVAESMDASGSNQISAAGAAYIFTYNGSAWVQIQKVVASDRATYDFFGKSVSISGDGNTFAVGADAEDEDESGANTLSGSGSVYIFTRDTANVLTSTWSQQKKLVATDRSAGAYFGSSLSVSSDGQTILVGAYGESEDVSGANTLTLAGAAYIFTYSGSTWTQKQKIVASNRIGDGYFGWGVSISKDGNVALIGEAGITGTGAAYTFTRDTLNDLTSSWTFQQKLVSNDITSGDVFGKNVSLSNDGNVAIISANGNGTDESGGNNISNAGAAYIFSRNGTTWSQIKKIVASDRTSSDNLSSSSGEGTGVSISSNGNKAIVGAALQDTDESGANNLTNAGAAYIFLNLASSQSNLNIDGNAVVTTANVEVDGELTVSGNVVVDTNTLFVDSVNNRVGVGTTTPDNKLDVDGNVFLSSGNSIRLGTAITNDNNAGIAWNDVHDSYFIKRGAGSWSSPDYTQLYMYWPTGIVLNPGNETYGKSRVTVIGNTRCQNSYSAPTGYTQMNQNGSVFRNYTSGGNTYGAGLHFTAGAVIPADLNGGGHQTIATQLGHTYYRWGQIYSTSSSISTSDRNKKQDINEITESERKVASKIVDLFRTFRMKDAVSKKGDEARLHNGVIAQDLIEVFQSEGLDARRYGLFCYDDIWLVDGENELYETVYEKDGCRNYMNPDGTEREYTPEDDGVKEVKLKTGIFADKDTPGAVATPGPYSIRYEELLCFVVAGELQNERIKYSTLEARVAALENV